VSRGHLLSDEEFGQALRSFQHTAFRLELQDAYAEPCEAELFAAFLNGDPFPATEVPELRDWYDNIAAHIRDGQRVERVRVQREPPTSYQQFERWLGQWNLQAGEVMRYLTRDRAHQIGLLPAAGEEDWWLLDSQHLVVMRFDGKGHRTGNELITDPVAVLQACQWRDLALHYSLPAHLPDLAA
jgi:hypothetical protein